MRSVKPAVGAGMKFLGLLLALPMAARQPQSGQTHDWTRSERRQARDRQFALRCQ
jgi:hypothetical protein